MYVLENVPCLNVSKIYKSQYILRYSIRNMYWLLYILDLHSVLFLCTTAVWQLAINEYVMLCYVMLCYRSLTLNLITATFLLRLPICLNVWNQPPLTDLQHFADYVVEAPTFCDISRVYVIFTGGKSTGNWAHPKCKFLSFIKRYRPGGGETICPPPADGSSTRKNRGGSTSVRERVRSPHLSGGRR